MYIFFSIKKWSCSLNGYIYYLINFFFMTNFFEFKGHNIKKRFFWKKRFEDKIQVYIINYLQ